MSYREYAEHVIEQAQVRAAAGDRAVDVVIETAAPAEAILQVISERDVDHVVMGSHGGDANRLTRRLLGTVATAVVAESPVPVASRRTVNR